MEDKYHVGNPIFPIDIWRCLSVHPDYLRNSSRTSLPLTNFFLLMVPGVVARRCV